MNAIAKVLRNGVELVSYVPKKGQIASPCTMPQEVVDQLARQFFGPLQASASVGYRASPVCTQLAERVFQLAGEMEIGEVLRVPAQPGDPSYMSRWDAASGRRERFDWVCVETFGEAA